MHALERVEQKGKVIREFKSCISTWTVHQIHNYKAVDYCSKIAVISLPLSSHPPPPLPFQDLIISSLTGIAILQHCLIPDAESTAVSWMGVIAISLLLDLAYWIRGTVAFRRGNQFEFTPATVNWFFNSIAEIRVTQAKLPIEVRI